ncbi:tetratricopeptide (TPR) repeat protein [Streptomyces luteogriseus]|uniref:tetratricopeptide repeat protein n=1 Tax=Streptomyces luteogriseus TaxID=68233 RepID=UPI0027832516|nr:tetratricopeptide repeat protein [Streptomyces luteogriseus]MDQ0710657.1 tetratricopeptide (TPR) repeat protein [Streptomyces luteogriseus]
MTDRKTVTTGNGVYGSTFNGPAAIQTGPFGTQNVQFVYQWKPAYRIEDFPAAPHPVRARALAEQPSRLLRASHQVVPFTGRNADLEALASWRDDPGETLAVLLVHGPGGQGKTRLAAHFAGLSRRAGWTVWQAVVNEADADPIGTSPLPDAGTGVLLVVDYAERWPTPDLRKLLQEPLWHQAGVPVRILLLARPAGSWWESLDTWIGDRLDVVAGAHILPPLADASQARADLFHQARDRFADHLGLHAKRAHQIGPPLDLDTNEDYAQVLTIHIAALAAVDAELHQDSAPTNPARASAYLLKRERAHWQALHQRETEPLPTTPEAMARTVLTATLTRPLARSHGWSALRQIGLADSTDAANILLDDHRYCYPPQRAVTVLEPLYPDRLGEDFLGLTTPASPDDPDTHPVSQAVTDDWAYQAAQRLLLGHTSPSTAAPWTRDALTVLIETARRWPHIATGQLCPLLKAHPELALHAGGSALATLAGLGSIDITVLEAIEPHLPADRHTDLDVGIAAIVRRLAQHRLATTRDPLVHARTNESLAVSQSYAGLRHEALIAGQDALRAWRDLARTKPAHQPDLARALTNLGTFLSAVGRRQEALSAEQEAVDIYRRLTAGNPAAHEPELAASLSSLGIRLSAVGQGQEALTAAEEAVDIYRRLAADNPAAHESELARSLSNLGNRLSAVWRRQEALTAEQEAVKIRRRLAAGNPAAHEPNLAASLSNLGACLSEVGQGQEALTVEQEAVDIYRRLAAGNPAAHEPGLARSLSNLGAFLSAVGQGQEALTVEQEAVDIYRRLAAGNPAAHEPELARSLSNLSIQLSEMGQGQEALTAAEEVEDIYRRLAAGNPAAHESELASSLSVLGAFLSAAGQGQEALTVEQEAVKIRRRLAAGNPAAHEPNLAASLSNLGACLSEVGRLQEALTATEEAVDIYRRLAAGNPAAHEPNLAGSLSNLGAFLLRVGRRQEALTVEQEAVDIYRRLAAGNPAAHEPNLATSLSVLAVLVAMGGNLSAALRTTEEAAELYRSNVALMPSLLPQLHAVLELQTDLLDIRHHPESHS